MKKIFLLFFVVLSIAHSAHCMNKDETRNLEALELLKEVNEIEDKELAKKIELFIQKMLLELKEKECKMRAVKRESAAVCRQNSRLQKSNRKLRNEIDELLTKEDSDSDE